MTVFFVRVKHSVRKRYELRKIPVRSPDKEKNIFVFRFNTAETIALCTTICQSPPLTVSKKKTSSPNTNGPMLNTSGQTCQSYAYHVSDTYVY